MNRSIAIDNSTVLGSFIAPTCISCGSGSGTGSGKGRGRTKRTGENLPGYKEKYMKK
jgi:hypothetical protein